MKAVAHRFPSHLKQHINSSKMEMACHVVRIFYSFVHPKERATGRYESFLDTSESVVADGFDSSKNSRGVQAVPIPRVVAHFPATGDEGLHRYAQAIAR